MNGGEILALKKVLGHHSLAMTMRYAHYPRAHSRDPEAESARTVNDG